MKNIAQCFEKQVKLTPEKVAVHYDNQYLSYSEMNIDANKIAHGLLNLYEYKDTENQQVVAIILEDSVEVISSMLGILKSGNLFVPLDYSYPMSRIKWILEDCSAKSIVCNNKTIDLVNKVLKNELNQINILNIDEIDQKIANTANPNIELSEESYAYILYTSGSTGNPKGVIQNHKSIIHILNVYSNRLNINNEDVIGLLTSPMHTVFIIDILSCLFNGATLAWFDIKRNENLMALSSWVGKAGITILHSVPVIYRHLISTMSELQEPLDKLRLIIVGGETVYRSDIEAYKEKFSDNCRFVNLFGSSEVFIASMNIINKDTSISGTIVPIGELIDDIKVDILDKDEAVGILSTGELVFSSDYLFAGYSNILKVEQGKRDLIKTFRSGDLGRKLPNGEIEFIGRQDFQIKVMSQRVELHEVEMAIKPFDGIKECVVHYFKDRNKNNYIVAYYVSEGENELDIVSIRKLLSQRLPEFMIPKHFIKLEKIPLTSSNKIDRLSLPEPILTQTEVRSEDIIDGLVDKIILIWKEVLNTDKVGVNDNFFSLGGNSLKVILLNARLKDELGLDISDVLIYEHLTISSLCEHINQNCINQI